MKQDTEENAAPVLARKRRMKLRAKQRSSEDEPEAKRPCFEDESDEASADARPKPSIRGIKKQARYEPGVPMSKEELVAWRKEARRVRNRESAAASRKRTRERISELEEEVKTLNEKYQAALERIHQLESSSPYASNAVLPDAISEDFHRLVSPEGTPESSPRVSFVQTAAPEEPFQLDDQTDEQDDPQKKYQLIMEKIQRPAAKIPGADTSDTSQSIVSESAFSSEDSSASSEVVSSDGSHVEDAELGEFLLEALDTFDPADAQLLELSVDGQILML